MMISGTIDRTEADTLISMALGRIFRMGSRPSRPDDIQEYERCRAAIFAAAEAGRLDLLSLPDHRPNFARDRARGAVGD